MDLNDLDNEREGEVLLYVYDMTKGLANSLSQMVLGRHIDGVWHTGIVVYGREYFYGGAGIESCHPGGTVLGQPDKVLKLGSTEVPYSLLLEYVFGLGESAFRPGTYDLFAHNCNNFSNDVATFLTGKSIPDYITNLPQDILSTPLGESLRPLLESLSLRAEGSRGVSFGARAEEAAERRFLEGSDTSHHRDVSPPLVLSPTPPPPPPTTTTTLDQPIRLSDTSDDRLTMGDTPLESNGDASAVDEAEPIETKAGTTSRLQIDDEEDSEEVSSIRRRDVKPREPPIVYSDVDAAKAFESIETHVTSLLNDEEKQLMAELHEFVVLDTGAWALGAQHLEMIGKILKDDNVSQQGKIALLQFLQAAALKDDVILLLHMDRKDHILMNYVNDFEQFQPDIQEEVAKLLCNLCQPATAADWLLYISEWTNDGRPCSNSRVTTRVGVNSLLVSDRPSLVEKGVALIYNLGLKEVFDDTATELASAILQFLHGDLTEEHVFQMLTALLKFMIVSYNDVPALVKMLGPDIGKFKGKSERVDNLTEQILFKLSMTGGGGGGL